MEYTAILIHELCSLAGMEYTTAQHLVAIDTARAEEIISSIKSEIGE